MHRSVFGFPTSLICPPACNFFSPFYACRRPTVNFERYEKLFVVVSADWGDLDFRLEAVSLDTGDPRILPRRW